MRCLLLATLSISVALSLSACAADPVVDAEAHCKAETACNPALDRDECQDKWETIAEESYASCTQELQAVLDCGGSNAQCDGSDLVDIPACQDQYAALGKCMHR